MSTGTSHFPIPVTIVSGFLGAGKTTLLRHLLAGAPQGCRIAVLENELGNVPVDDALLADAGPATIETVLGRSCCEARSTFVKKLHGMALMASDLDRLIIESTGVAHPGMLAHAFLSDPILRRIFRIDGIITVVDAANFEAHAGRDGHATEQVAYADVLILNKEDLVPADQVERLKALLSGINSTAAIHVTRNACIPAAGLLDLGGFDLSRIEHGVDGCHDQGNPARRPATGIPSANEDSDHAHKHGHRHEIEAVALSLFDFYDFARFKAWLEGFIGAHGETLYRAKGVVALHGVRERLVFHGVHGHFQIGLGRPWGGDRIESRMVFIGRDLDREAIARGLADCRARGGFLTPMDTSRGPVNTFNKDNA